MVCQPPKTPNFFFSTRKVHHHGWFNRVTCEVLCPCRCSKLLPRMCRRPLGPDEWDIALGGQGDMCVIYCNPAPPENIFCPQNLPKTPSWGGIWMSRVVTSAHLRCHFCLRTKIDQQWSENTNSLALRLMLSNLRTQQILRVRNQQRSKPRKEK